MGKNNRVVPSQLAERKDPQYRPGDASNAHFWVETTITSPVSNKKVSGRYALDLVPQQAVHG